MTETGIETETGTEQDEIETAIVTAVVATVTPTIVASVAIETATASETAIARRLRRASDSMTWTTRKSASSDARIAPTARNGDRESRRMIWPPGTKWTSTTARGRRGEIENERESQAQQLGEKKGKGADEAHGSGIERGTSSRCIKHLLTFLVHC